MTPLELVTQAISKNEFVPLLLGQKGYGYFDKYSGAPLPTDITSVLQSGIYPYAENNPSFNMRSAIDSAMPEFQDSTLGLSTLASILHFEAYQLSKKGFCLGLDIDNMTDILRDSIVRYRSDLEKEKRFGGKGYSNGLAGDLKRLSDIVVENGGRAFFPD